MAAADYRLMTEATGQRIAVALENLAGFGSYLTTADVVNNLTSTATDKPLSAAQGKALAFIAVGQSSFTVTTSSGEVLSSTLRLYYSGNAAYINGRIRIKNAVGRPTITISGIPAACPAFAGHGNPTEIRMNGASSGSIISDPCVLAHTGGTTTATITFENFIGEFPTAEGGYIVATFSVFSAS